MRKVIFSINTTLDGCIDHTAGVADEGTHVYYARLHEQAGAVLFGRKTYQLLADYWPAALKDPNLSAGMRFYAEQINRTEKVVFSHTLETTTWENSRLVKGDAAEEIRRLKQGEGRFLILAGNTLAVSLLPTGLIDEYRFYVNPVVWGRGPYLLNGLKASATLELVQAEPYPSGCVLLTYRKKPD